MRRYLLALPLLLAACGLSAPGPAEWQATVRGVPITYALVPPGSLGVIATGDVAARANYNHVTRTGHVSVDVARSRHGLVRTIAHEVGHILYFHHGLQGFPRTDLGPHYQKPLEGWAETYADLYINTCGESLAPLGWTDYAKARCTEAPDPREVRAP